ncbi:MAG: sulfatase [Deltaproteobacteria bacterium]|nr:sulfatase [Deltaproteobacteria bacterium]
MRGAVNSQTAILGSSWSASLNAALLAFFFLALCETLRVPWIAYRSQPMLYPGVLALGLGEGLRLLFVPIVAVLAVTVSYAIPGFRYRGAIRFILTAGATTSAAYYLYRVLVQYHAFRGYLPFILFFLFLALGLYVAYSTAHSPWSERSNRSRTFTWVIACASLAGFALAIYFNYALYKGLYPTLHLSAHQTAFLLLHCGLLHLLIGVLNRDSRIRFFILGGGALFVAGVLLASSLALGTSFAAARPVYASFTVLGQSRVVKKTYDVAKEDKLIIQIPEDRAAIKRFIANSNFPKLADDFKSNDFNILLITVEAFRFDQTSCYRSNLRTTPNLAALGMRGAFVFKRAYAPSSGTVHSLASLFTMTYPSHAPVETWAKAWYGELDANATTVAELAREAGYETFWISHSHYGCFTNRMLGFDQGFQRASFVEEWTKKDNNETDREIADLAIRSFKQRADSKAKFFGWIFFASPHSPYVVQYPNWPKNTKLDLYRQEVRFFDQQLGRVIKAMEQTGLFEKTIIIVTGDHGEEFGEHGGSHHKATVYSEVTHVPLVIRIPGVKGFTIPNPTSTTYTFPWLFLRQSGTLRKRAENVIRDEIGPMMRATDAAVIIEMVGHDRMQSSLVYENYKVNYDFITEGVEVFDLKNDPREQTNLLFTSPALASTFYQKINRYRRVRATHRKMTLAPNKHPEPIAKRDRKKASQGPEQ